MEHQAEDETEATLHRVIGITSQAPEIVGGPQYRFQNRMTPPKREHQNFGNQTLNPKTCISLYNPYIPLYNPNNPLTNPKPKALSPQPRDSEETAGLVWIQIPAFRFEGLGGRVLIEPWSIPHPVAGTARDYCRYT